MKQKLQQLLKSEGLTASRLAEMLEIQPAGVSHLIAGRNKPSFDLLQKILRRFPDINPDWLLLDDEQMYRSDSGKTHEISISTSEDLFSKKSSNDTASTNILNIRRDGEKMTAQEELICNTANKTSEIIPRNTSAQIDRIVIFYADGSFTDYNPR